MSRDRGHFAAVICWRIENSQVEVLVVPKLDDRGNTYGYGFPGGEQKLNESILDAAVRELEEETGIKSVKNRLTFITKYRVDGNEEGKYHIKYFFMSQPGNHSEKIQAPKFDEDIGKGAWIPLLTVYGKLLQWHKRAVEEVVRRTAHQSNKFVEVSRDLEGFTI